MPSPEVRLAVSEADRRQAFAVRIEVFVEEQGVPASLELDEHDATADHFLALLDGQAVGAGRLLPSDGDLAVLGRLAVRRQARGTGLGVLLVRAVEDRAAERGLRALLLHSQTQATGFYERLGYESYGPEELEAGIPHVWMRKNLT
ncbi:MAG: GNAT family N-acetyltransferase [Streptosporangiaceae bacterium]